MALNPERKRSHPLKLQITPTLYADLVAVSEAMGQTPSTAAAFAIGQWVSQQKRSLGAAEKAVNAVFESAGPEILAQFKIAMEKQ
jgi:hypothetical protein